MQLLRKNCLWLLLGCFLLNVCSQEAEAANRILFMSPFPAPSHWMWLKHFQNDLLERGHHVTSITNYRAKEKHSNLTEIIIEPKYDIPYYFPKGNAFSSKFTSDFQKLQLWWKVGLLTTEYALNDSNVQQLIRSHTNNFDLVILEQFFHESFLMFAYKFRCPIVTIGTMGFMDHMDFAMGLITPWSIVPHLVLSYTVPMTFKQRAYNTYLSCYDVLIRNWYYLPKMQKMAQQHFQGHVEGPLPDIKDLEKNISIMLINSHRSIDDVRPTISGLISVGGAHIKPANPLPHNIKFFMDNATEGVVYFSLGSYMKSTDMPPERVATIIKAFSQLKVKVLWKYESNTMGYRLPSNLMLEKWLPQNDILAHPNIKAFITHGGVFGTQEALYWGVPMLCIPLFGDQYRNTHKAVSSGYALSLVFSEMSTDDLVNSIEVLLYNSCYKQNALLASRRFRDNPIHPLAEASYWIEYVIRYKGAHHLKSHSIQVPLYQYLLLDVIVAFLLIIGVLIWLLRLVIGYSLKLIIEIVLKDSNKLKLN